MAKYPYFELPPKEKPIYCPWLPVTLNYRKTHKITQPIMALVDSGADICLCSKDIGIWLGINFKKLKTTIDITGIDNCPIKAVKEMVTLCISNFKDFETPFYFSDSYPLKKPLILGQRGFFDHFVVNFDYRNKEFEIR